MADPVIVKVDPIEGNFAMLIPILQKRMETYAAEFNPEVDAGEMSRAYAARIFNRDQRLLPLVLVEPDTSIVVGHLVAETQEVGTRFFVTILSKRADRNVGDAMTQATSMVAYWARSKGASKVLAVSKDGKDLEKLGFKKVRTILRFDIPLEAAS